MDAVEVGEGPGPELGRQLLSSDPQTLTCFFFPRLCDRRARIRISNAKAGENLVSTGQAHVIQLLNLSDSDKLPSNKLLCVVPIFMCPRVSEFFRLCGRFAS